MAAISEHRKRYKQEWREKNKERSKTINKIWREKNKDHLKVYGEKWRESNPEYGKKWELKNREHRKKISVQYFVLKPWVRTLRYINSRCNNPKASKYSSYGGRGIKNFLTSSDLKFLWFRDQAVNMTKPSIDRIDSDGHYSLENCRYLETEENRKRRLKLAA